MTRGRGSHMRGCGCGIRIGSRAKRVHVSGLVSTSTPLLRACQIARGICATWLVRLPTAAGSNRRVEGLSLRAALAGGPRRASLCGNPCTVSARGERRTRMDGWKIENANSRADAILVPQHSSSHRACIAAQRPSFDQGFPPTELYEVIGRELMAWPRLDSRMQRRMVFIRKWDHQKVERVMSAVWRGWRMTRSMSARDPNR